MTDVFFHVGLAKTGTTTIQAALEASAGRLAAEGVLFPGGHHRAQRLAVYDLLGQRVRGEEGERVAGSLQRLLDEVSAHDGPSVVVSEEELSLARPREVRRLVRRLDGHRVFVVVGARDVARTVVSAWQQTVVNGGTISWQDFIASVRGEIGAAPSEGISFWWRHDVCRVIDAWASAVPVDRIRLVTVPPPGAGPGALLERFGEAARLPDGWSGSQQVPRNASLGAAQLEVVRRLNESVTGRLNTSQHRFVVEAGIRTRLVGAPDRSLRLPAEHWAWARAHGEALVAELEQRGLAVHGDLGDLLPECPVAPTPNLDEVGGEELLAATQAALTSLALDHGRLFRRYRRAFLETEGRLPGPAEVLASQARAGSFHLRKWTLHQADHHPLVARASRAYLGRTTRPRVVDR
ncbi:hypothetical protein SAMN05192575_108112 [Nocardioides alpinus]|uniref:Sulfotransferase family protein n=1 Tax=Nocardioides alpinus TaxID=748909 RepID=A0A1I1ABH2_9ACTN|nr:hypothetical protein [Nocardioides alpinus]PKH43485.1 hypothetical protein CXG46_03210 [Nocardioides alpinus]SFB35331.1 hypothetical protein SAMN05192575_108112 [Nocardioides alpinus]